MINITVSMASGGSTTELQVAAADSMLELCSRIAAGLALPKQRLALVGPNGNVLSEEGCVGDALLDGALLTAVKLPCNVKASEYAGHVKHWSSYPPDDWGTMAFKRLCRVEFPPSTGRDVNMMPFVMGEEESLPNDLRAYWPMIMTCLDNGGDEEFGEESERGKVCFLTVQETEVEEGAPQRRPGLHVDRHSPDKPGPGGKIRWGGCTGGIFLCSSVDKSTRVWSCRIKPDAIGDLGSVEHLREHIGEGDDIEAGELVWLTDVTPHQSLPLSTPGPRQFFRLVTSEVTQWYAHHSTPNPLGTEPKPGLTEIVYGNKFDTA